MLFRSIPVIAKWAGFKNIGEKIVQHRKREFGETKFGMNRFINGYLDLISIMFVSKFSKKPMHFFGVWGTIMFVLGFISAAILGTQKIIASLNHLPMRLVSDSPYFFISLTLMMMGSMMFLTGFLAELIGRNSPSRNTYLIQNKINIKE